MITEQDVDLAKWVVHALRSVENPSVCLLPTGERVGCEPREMSLDEGRLYDVALMVLHRALDKVLTGAEEPTDERSNPARPADDGGSRSPAADDPPVPPDYPGYTQAN